MASRGKGKSAAAKVVPGGAAAAGKRTAAVPTRKSVLSREVGKAQMKTSYGTASDYSDEEDLSGSAAAAAPTCGIRPMKMITEEQFGLYDSLVNENQKKLFIQSLPPVGAYSPWR